ncbi:hypothetical protein TrVFT333_009384 [Trichoderma virens FT-333]|nr:hypothetical protein TrVFT333_009384 [Trichoderma virens FT-333]
MYARIRVQKERVYGTLEFGFQHVEYVSGTTYGLLKRFNSVFIGGAQVTNLAIVVPDDFEGIYGDLPVIAVPGSSKTTKTKLLAVIPNAYAKANTE